MQFDPVNALLMCLLADEMRQGRVASFAEVSLPTKQRMIEIYEVLAKALPNDPAARQYTQLVAATSSPRLVQEIREVLRALTQLAKLEKARAEQSAQSPRGGKQLSGDDLTAIYVREAAAVVREFQSADAVEAMLLALGIFMDTDDALRSFPLTQAMVAQVESANAQDERLPLLGGPQMRGREDLAKHFFVSAHLAVAMGGANRGVSVWPKRCLMRMGERVSALRIWPPIGQGFCLPKNCWPKNFRWRKWSMLSW